MLNKKEKKGGLHNQLNNNKPEPIKKYTKEHLIKVFEKVFSKVDNSPDRKMKLPLEWKHYEWEENGEQFSCWKLTAGGLMNVLTTGDGGKEKFDKLMKEEFSKLPKITE